MVVVTVAQDNLINFIQVNAQKVSVVAGGDAPAGIKQDF
jgi:hypothetical protein